jgi:uncharacterized protein YcbK (DUF882 family)
MPQLSKNFHSREFNCKDGTPCPRRDYNGLEYLCKTFLEPLRREFGRVTIHSGYRTRAHNARVGGEPNSFHIYTMHDGNDQAADITCERGRPSDWHRKLARIRARRRDGKGGLGLYRTFVHVDIRDFPANWRG